VFFAVETNKRDAITSEFMRRVDDLIGV
jgi:hypothetical protein